jgi:hypothetical protein
MEQCFILATNNFRGGFGNQFRTAAPAALSALEAPASTNPTCATSTIGKWLKYWNALDISNDMRQNA